MRRRFFRHSFRQEQESRNAADRFYASTADMEPQAQAVLAPKRERIRRPVDNKPVVPLEKDVLRAVGDLLAVHPKVLFAVRQNSGGMQWADAQGESHSMWFYRIVTRQPVRISDYWGILRDGRMLAMECKRSNFKAPSDKREYEQAAFLMLVRNCGGIAGFVSSADEALALLA